MNSFGRRRSLLGSSCTCSFSLWLSRDGGRQRWQYKVASKNFPVPLEPHPCPATQSRLDPPSAVSVFPVPLLACDVLLSVQSLLPGQYIPLHCMPVDVHPGKAVEVDNRDSHPLNPHHCHPLAEYCFSLHLFILNFSSVIWRLVGELPKADGHTEARDCDVISCYLSPFLVLVQLRKMEHPCLLVEQPCG